MKGVVRFFQKNQKAILLGATALPAALTGCATQMVAQPAPTLPTGPGADTFEAFKARADEINGKRGTIPHAELNTARNDLYREFSRMNRHHPSLTTDADGDGVALAKEILFGTSDQKIDSDGDLMSDAFEIENGLDPASKQLEGRANVNAWTHGYIPMSNNPMVEDKGLLFYDLLMKDRTGTDPQLRHVEGRSALDGGHYFLSSTLDEKNAELTAAKDFNRDGVLTPGVVHDFLKPGASEASFGTDGKTETTLSVGWWGHCNDVASAGINFREPTKNVTFELDHPFTLYTVTSEHGVFKAESVKPGATHTDIELLSGQTVRLPNASITATASEQITKLEFTPTMLKELAAELVHRGSNIGSDFVGSRFYGRDATIELKNGTTVRGGLTSSLEDRAEVTPAGAMVTAKKFSKDISVRVFDFSEGKFVSKTYKAEDIKSVSAENARDVNPLDFHMTMLKWLGSEGKAGIMDRDASAHVWNYAFDRYSFTETAREGTNKVDYTMNVYFVGNSYPTTYKYSLNFEGGKPTSGDWASDSPNPDFFWRHEGGAKAYDHERPGKYTPLKYSVITELLNKSYAIEDGSSAATNHGPSNQ